MTMTASFRRFTLMTLLMALPLLFAACSKDKDSGSAEPSPKPQDSIPDEEKPDPEVVRPTTEIGTLQGRFSVSDGYTVRFSQGNLQYQASSNTFRFAGRQYDFIGAANKEIGASNEGWIDLFGWGTSGYHNEADANNVYYAPYSNVVTNTAVGANNYYGYGPSIDMANADLVNESKLYDWGEYAAIANGGGQAGIWRTLTKDEWVYLVNTRSASTVNGVANARFAKATIIYSFDTVLTVKDQARDTNLTWNIKGLLLFPDQYTHPADAPAIARINNKSTNYDGNKITAEQFQTMEEAGMVFLPAAGRRDDKSVYSTATAAGAAGNYWSSTHSEANGITSHTAYEFLFSDAVCDPASSNNRCGGRAVRLVQN